MGSIVPSPKWVTVGDFVGAEVGLSEGTCVGDIDGADVRLPEGTGVGDFVGAEVEVGAEACCLSPACWLDLDLASEYGRTFGHMHVPFGKMTRHTRK